MPAIVRPRLTDYYNLPIAQENVSFAIPFLDEDIPLFLDPFLLWKSPSQQDNALHDVILNSFNRLGMLYLEGKVAESVDMLKTMSECSEVGLGSGRTKRGLRISTDTAKEILELFRDIPQINKNGFKHFEIIQLYIGQVSKDNFVLLKPLFVSIHQEMRELAKKKPDGAINGYKLNLINKVLQPLKDLMANENVATYIEILDEAIMPSNSDVLLLLGQYEKAMEMFYETYSSLKPNSRYEREWNVK